MISYKMYWVFNTLSFGFLLIVNFVVTTMFPISILQVDCFVIAYLHFHFTFTVHPFITNSFHIATKFTLAAFVRPFTISSSIVIDPSSSFPPFVRDSTPCLAACLISCTPFHQCTCGFGLRIPVVSYLVQVLLFASCTWCGGPSHCRGFSSEELLTYQIISWRMHDFLSQFFRFLFYELPYSDWLAP